MATHKKDSSKDVTLALASSSPRRRELIRALDMPVEPLSPDGEEDSLRNGEEPRELVLRLSLNKARQVSKQAASNTVVIGADTVIVLNGEVLGKPAGYAEATDMLRRLRGDAHRVLTGVTALDSKTGQWQSVVNSTDVYMRQYSDEEIASYVETGQPLDKAGGYGIQDEVFRPVQSIHGCYLNVVGLPLCDVIMLLNEFGVRIRLRPDWRIPDQCQGCVLKELRGA